MTNDLERGFGYCLFLDDVRLTSDIYPDGVHPDGWVVARCSDEAILLVKERGMPSLMSLDHDLGDNDTVMYFLKWLAYEYWTEEPVPCFAVHSANPVGSENIYSFMKSWKRSTNLS